MGQKGQLLPWEKTNDDKWKTIQLKRSAVWIVNFNWIVEKFAVTFQLNCQFVFLTIFIYLQLIILFKLVPWLYGAERSVVALRKGRGVQKTA